MERQTVLFQCFGDTMVFAALEMSPRKYKDHCKGTLELIVH